MYCTKDFCGDLDRAYASRLSSSSRCFLKQAEME